MVTIAFYTTVVICLVALYDAFLIQFNDIISCEENIMTEFDIIDGTVIAGTYIEMTITTTYESDCICITVLANISWLYVIKMSAMLPCTIKINDSLDLSTVGSFIF